MSTGVIVTWWIALALALVLILVAWMLINRVILTAKRIEANAKRTLAGAEIIAQGTQAVGLLNITNQVAGEILETAKALSETTAGLGKKLPS